MDSRPLSRLLLTFLSVFDKFFSVLLWIHDQLLYKPLQKALSPLVLYIPRQVTLGRYGRITVFTANGITLTRTFLVCIIVLCLKCHFFTTGCLLVVLHDFLDHLDGIVAKAHRTAYGHKIDQPLLGAFLDAFCDKIVNVTLLWSILLLTDYSTFSWCQFTVYVSIPLLVISSEIILGTVRVQDYYKAKFSDGEQHDGLAASIEGKLKEKLETIGLAMLCLALSTKNPITAKSGIAGIFSLFLSLRFAYSSLMHKLKARRPTQTETSKPEIENLQSEARRMVPVLDDELPEITSRARFHLYSNGYEDSISTEDTKNTSPVEMNESKVDKIYTVGCFDLFHRGHKRLLMNMRNLGKEIIVGIHDDESYEKLKHKRAIDNIEKRIKNVKEFADQVYVVAGTNPAPYLLCSFHLKEGETAMYVRGDDMPNFPARATVEKVMPVKLLPYTQGVSSTDLRAKLLQQQENSPEMRTNNH